MFPLQLFLCWISLHQKKVWKAIWYGEWAILEVYQMNHNSSVFYSLFNRYYCIILLVKPLNILLLGPQYAESLGISTRQIRNNTISSRRSVNSHHNRFLWSYFIYRVSYSTYSPPLIPYWESSDTSSRNSVERCCNRFTLQLYLLSSWRIRYNPT